MLCEPVMRWADMIRAEYEGDTLRQAQLAKALAERLSATPDTGSQQHREDRVRKFIIGSLQSFFDTLKEARTGRYTNDARAAFHDALWRALSRPTWRTPPSPNGPRCLT